MSSINHSTKDRIRWQQVTNEFMLTMLLPPLISIPRLVTNAMSNKSNSTNKYAVYIVCISTIIASFIATKPPSGDQVTYSVAYQNVPNQGFIGSLTNIYGIQESWEESRNHLSVEFMNGVYNYVGYYVTMGYYPLFLLLYFTTEFSLIGFGLFHYCKNMKDRRVPIVYGMLTLLFFYLFFLMCSQLQKQYLGQAIMMYVLGCYSDYRKMTKKLWLLAITAVLTHQSMILFAPFLILKSLNKRLTRKALILFIGIMVVFILIGPKIAGNLTAGLDNASTSVLTYGANRLAQGDKYDDGGSMDITQFTVVCLPMLYILWKKLWKERRSVSNHEAFILNIILLLIFAVLAMANIPLVQYRYFNVMFAFLPFIYPFAFNNVKIRNLFLKTIGITMVIILLLTISSTGRLYAPVFNLIIEPPFLLIAHIY